jgi:hypothetical protein
LLKIYYTGRFIAIINCDREIVKREKEKERGGIC